MRRESKLLSLNLLAAKGDWKAIGRLHFSGWTEQWKRKKNQNIHVFSVLVKSPQAAADPMRGRYAKILKGLKAFLLFVDACLLVGCWWYLRG